MFLHAARKVVTTVVKTLEVPNTWVHREARNTKAIGCCVKSVTILRQIHKSGLITTLALYLLERHSYGTSTKQIRQNHLRNGLLRRPRQDELGSFFRNFNIFQTFSQTPVVVHVTLCYRLPAEMLSDNGVRYALSEKLSIHQVT